MHYKIVLKKDKILTLINLMVLAFIVIFQTLLEKAMNERVCYEVCKVRTASFRIDTVYISAE
jgi:hypothetical protein